MKVSGILPTRGRSEWVKHAVESFLLQDYVGKELLILDDADDPSYPAFPMISGRNIVPPLEISYFQLEYRASIPAKRNYLAERATGEFIVHFDSDDWSDPHRITDQVERLEASGLAVTGYSQMLFFDEEQQRVGLYKGDDLYALGTSLMYRTSWWRDHPFDQHRVIGEDNDFIYQAAVARQLITVPGVGMQVARAHRWNTSPKNIDDFRERSLSDLPAGFPCNRRDCVKS